MSTFFLILGKTKVEGIYLESLGKIYLLKIAKKTFCPGKVCIQTNFHLEMEIRDFFKIKIQVLWLCWLCQPYNNFLANHKLVQPVTAHFGLQRLEFLYLNR